MLSPIHLLRFSRVFSIGLEPGECVGENYHYSRDFYRRMKSRSAPLIRTFDTSLTEQGSTAQMLESLELSLGEIEQRIRHLFAQKQTVVNASLFLKCLLSSGPHKTGWTRAVVTGDSGPWRQQALLGRDR
jgi:hypothetical protein